MWGVLGSVLSHAPLPVFGAWGRGPLPTACGCGGCGRRDPSATPQSALLRARFARCEGATRALRRRGASCLGVGRPGLAALPSRTAHPWGVRPAPATNWLRVQGAGLWDPSPTPQRTLLRAGLARCGGSTLAWAWGVWYWALSHAQRHIIGACSQGPLPTCCGRGGVAWGCITEPNARALASWLCALCGRHQGAGGGGALAWVWGVRGWAPSHARPLVLGVCGGGPLSTGRGCGFPWYLLPCRGLSCVVRAPWVCGPRWPLLLGTCYCAVVIAGGVPLWRASWTPFGAPRLVRSGRSRCSGWLFRRRGAFSQPEGCRPRIYWAPAPGTCSPARYRAHCACHSPMPRQRRWARSVSYPFGTLRWGCPWRVPPASVLGCVRCGGSPCVDPVSDASGFPYLPSFNGGLGR